MEESEIINAYFGMLSPEGIRFVSVPIDDLREAFAEGSAQEIAHASAFMSFRIMAAGHIEGAAAKGVDLKEVRKMSAAVISELVTACRQNPLSRSPRRSASGPSRSEPESPSPGDSESG